MSETEHERVELPEEVVEFLVESNENLDRLDQDLVALETDPSNKERISSIFRTIHTIKGTCGFLGFTRLEAVAHVGENLLSKIRDETYTLDAEKTDVLLEMVDVVRGYLAKVSATGTEGTEEHADLISKLQHLVDGKPPPKPRTKRSVRTKSVSSNAFVFSDEPEPTKTESVGVDTATKEPDKLLPEIKETPPASESKVLAEVKNNISDSSVRVDVSLLDNLMDLVGELVLARNQILQYTSTDSSSALSSTTQRLNLITSELQENVMKTRMQPIGTVLAKFPRVVRDLANSCGKKVDLVFEGKETELDRTIIEAIKDPLTHLIRNSVDHGIETPEQRRLLGKKENGILRISAYHESGYVNIEISDDGSGIDPEKIKAKAIEKGIVSSDLAMKLSDRETTALIFAPGFSTAEKITNVSGRGVGMDVVKTNIEKIGGSIDVVSTPNQGTTFKIKIPLTLAIVPALIVSCTGERYAIAQTSLVELLKLDEEQIKKAVAVIDGRAVLRLRGKLVPLVDLGSLLRLNPSKDIQLLDSINVVVVQGEHGPFGISVDGVVDTQEIVVKPLGKQVKDVGVFSGATIMGDGRVALILDVGGVASAGALDGSNSRNVGSKEGVPEEGSEHESKTLLVVRAGDNSRLAISLESIDRLEEFDVGDVEWAGAAPVVQYRDAIMPLLWLSSALGSVSSSNEEQSLYQVVVHSVGSRSVGVVVDDILDITEVSVKIDPYSARLGVLGSAVIAQKVTEIVDLSVIVESFLSSYEGIGV